MGLSWELNEIKHAWHTADTQYMVIMLRHRYCWTFIIIITHCAVPTLIKLALLPFSSFLQRIFRWWMGVLVFLIEGFLLSFQLGEGE